MPGSKTVKVMDKDKTVGAYRGKTSVVGTEKGTR